MSVAQAAGDVVKDLLRADLVLIGTAADQGTAIDLLYATDPDVWRRVYRLSADTGASGRAFRQQNVVIVRDYRKWEEASVPGLEFGTCTAIACPLLVAGRSIGVLTITWRSHHTATSDETALLQSVAAQLAAVLEASRLLALAEQRRQDNRVLVELIGATAVDHDLGQFLHRISEAAGRLLRADDAGVSLLSGDGSAYMYLGWINRAPSQRMVTIRADEGVTGEVLRSGKAVLLKQSVRPEPMRRLFESVGAAPGGTILGVPLVDRGAIVGVLRVGWHADPDKAPEEVDVATVLARYAARAVEGNRIRLRARSFHQVAQELASHGDLREALEGALPNVARMLKAGYVAVWMRRPDGDFRLAATAGDRSFAGELAPLTSDSRAGQLAPDDLVNLLNGDLPRRLAQEWSVHNPHLPAYLAVPVQRARTVLGIVEAMRPTEEPFSSSDERLLAEIADVIGLAVTTASVQVHEGAYDSWLAAILEALPSGVIVLDADGRVAFINRTGRRMATRPLELGKPLAYQTADLQVTQRQADGAKDVGDLVAALLDGEEFEDLPQVVRDPLQDIDLHVQATGRVLRDARGRTIGAVGVFTDTSVENRLRQELSLATRDNAYLRGELEERDRRLDDLARRLPPAARVSEVALEELGVTRREQDVLRLVVEGRTNAEIAAELHVSLGTVKLHVKRILAKLSAPTRTAAAVRALELGIARSRTDYVCERG